MHMPIAHSIVNCVLHIHDVNILWSWEKIVTHQQWNFQHRPMIASVSFIEHCFVFLNFFLFVLFNFSIHQWIFHCLRLNVHIYRCCYITLIFGYFSFIYVIFCNDFVASKCQYAIRFWFLFILIKTFHHHILWIWNWLRFQVYNIAYHSLDGVALCVCLDEKEFISLYC